MATTSKYFVLTPPADNLDFLDFDLRYGSITTAGESIQYNGTSKVDSIFVRPGLNYDLSNTAGGTDKIYLTGNLADYSYTVTGSVLNLSRSVNAKTESVTVAAGTPLNFDNLVFANGTVNAFTLYNAVKNTTALPAPSPLETSLAPSGAAAPGAPLNATIKAFSVNPAGVGQVGETFASTKPGINLIVNGGNGIDTVYVADGEKVDATVLGGSVDLVYFRGTWADYTKSVINSGTQLLFTRSIGGHLESVTVTAGTVLNYDKLIFADGAVSTNNAKTAITTDPTGPITNVPGVDPTTTTPLYNDDEVQAALNAIRDAAQNNTATDTSPSVMTYAAAGAKGVSAANLASINSALDSAVVNGALADTAPEIQTIVDGYNAILNSADGVAGNTTTALTGAQYGAIGVTGVSGTASAGNALFLLDDAVDSSARSAVDAEPEVQAMADAANHVMAAAGGTAAQAAALTQSDLGALGVTGVNATNLAAIQAAVQAAASDSAVDTRAELQAIVNQTLAGQGVDLGAIAAGSGGFVINGQVANAATGWDVADAGDVNGDGLADLIIGNGAFGGTSGHAYVVYGKTDSTQVNLNAVLAGQGGFAIGNNLTPSFVGYSVSGAGDVNGDGLADVIVGTSGGYERYVVFGKTDNAAVDLNAVAAGNGGFVITERLLNGMFVQYGASYHVSDAGDVNGDGLSDLLFTTYQSQSSLGGAIVVYGKTDGAAVALNDVVAGNGGFLVLGNTSTFAANVDVHSAGDVNGDGLSDLLVSTVNYADSGHQSTTVLFGKAGGGVSTGFTIDAGQASCSSAGDVNGDGLDDLIVNSTLPQYTGEAWVVFGKTGTGAVDRAALAAGTGGFLINPGTAGIFQSVSGAGDINGDGLADLLIGAALDRTHPSTSYVVYGKADGTTVNLADVSNGIGGFAIHGVDFGDAAGAAVSNAGDLNGDGFADLVIGAPNANGYAGKTYVVFGGSQFAAGVDFLGDANANTLLGSSAAETFVAGAGNDTLVGNGGADVMYGGAGNDTFVLNASNVAALQNPLAAGGNVGQLARVDGGTGVDTLQLSGGASLNLLAVANQGAQTPDGYSRINSIEKIDMATDSASNTLTLSLQDVLDMSGMNLVNANSKASLGWTAGTYQFAATETRHQLIIDGSSADRVVSSGGFVDTGLTAILNGHSYEVYNQSSSHAQLLIDQSINRQAVL